MQASPPPCFPFFGFTPDQLAQHAQAAVFNPEKVMITVSARRADALGPCAICLLFLSCELTASCPILLQPLMMAPKLNNKVHHGTRRKAPALEESVMPKRPEKRMKMISGSAGESDEKIMHTSDGNR